MLLCGFLSIIWINKIINVPILEKTIKKIVEFEYHDYEDLQKVIGELHNTKCAGISKIYSIGKSVMDRDLTVLMLTSRMNESEFVPEFFYAANIHGNEPVSKEILLVLVEDICDEYRRNEHLARLLVDNIRIHFLFSLNPDGFENAKQECRGNKGRSNQNGVDLNRNFKYLDYEPKDKIQPETEAAIKWVQERYFVLSAVGHGGAMVVSYPLDGDKSMQEEFLPAKDHDFILAVSKQYASLAGEEFIKGCGDAFPDGVTNGAEWYPLLNSFQDYVYYETSGIQITLELSCCKFPKTKKLKYIYKQHKQALLEYIRKTLSGVKGRISYRNGNPVTDASISFSNGGKTIKTTKDGYFMKNMLPGVYSLTVKTKSQSGSHISSDHEFFVWGEDTTTELNIFID